MRLRRLVSLQCASLAALPACASLPKAQRASDTLLTRVHSPAFEARGKTRMEAGHIPGLSLGVKEADRVVHAAGFGWADVEAKRAMTAQTLMNIASITKALTCAALVPL